MASNATSSAVSVAENGKTKARPNPRRRASKMKQADTVSKPVPVRKTEVLTETSSKSSACSKPGLNISKAPRVKPNASKQNGCGANPRPKRSKSNLQINAAEGADGTRDAKPQNNSGPLALAAPAVVTGGLLGCAAGAAVILGAGIWKNFAGVDNAILTARTAKLCIDNLIEEIITSLKAGTYNAPEALDMLRRTTLAYASSIPGGAPLVERIFREVEMVRRQRGAEVDKVLGEAYLEIARAQKKNAGADELQSMVFKQAMKLSTFATKATQDVLARNPKWRPYQEEARRTLRGPPESKVPTVKVNMAVQQKGLQVK
ncbi:hypothetical protein CKM354_001198200 [Cercospora kikuchii]|uniref:Uncharacterized protein n=1 Tax=Cercospora kikuchii TaxID=84275 RepID=A0A9P3CQJ0_9PEZI|nr:uncharacterized protein CKM354_001198200 [Cercospora kikuchii]GIZ48939.1 hypothetical protein CKM354_001198200 [Cercospora kikuchii]